MTKPIALYARVSTDDQHPDAQLSELRAYAKRRDVEATEYVDHGVSGQRNRRPALDRMLQAARRQEVSAVVVVRLDRLARSLAHMARVGEELQALGIEARAAALTRGAASAEAEAVRSGLARLTDPAQMGSLFKVLAISHPGLNPPGFEDAS